MKNLVTTLDTRSVPIYGREISDSAVQTNALSGVEYTVTIPSGAHVAIFSSSHNVFYSFATFALPTAGNQTTSNVSLNPEVIEVEDETTIYMRATDDSYISVEFYKIVG